MLKAPDVDAYTYPGRQVLGNARAMIHFEKSLCLLLCRLAGWSPGELWARMYFGLRARTNAGRRLEEGTSYFGRSARRHLLFGRHIVRRELHV